MAFYVENGYPIFTGADGLPLENGYIFVGRENLNPLSNPIDAYWDEALTVPAVNIRTKGGYPVYKGSPGRIHTSEAYSLLVQDKNRSTVYYQPTMADLSSGISSPEPGVGGLPLGAILPLNGVTFTGFLELGTTGLSATEYEDLFESDVDVIKDNEDGTFDLLDSGGTTGWVANSDWTATTITVEHDLDMGLTDLEIEVFVSSLGSDATAIRILDTSFDENPAEDFEGGISIYGVNSDEFIVRTGLNGVDTLDTDGSRLTLTDQSWYYKINYKRKDLPYPAQINSREMSSVLRGGTPEAAIVTIEVRKGLDEDWISEDPILSAGEFGYATDSEVLKIGDGENVWTALPSIFGEGTITTDALFHLNDQTITENYTVPLDKNASTVGPVTIDSAVTVTVSEGSVWAIL